MTVSRMLFDLPDAMKRLPVDDRGYPVPEFVRWMEDGKPDFRILKDGFREKCYRQKICWLCGGKLGSRMWFVLGPMCSVTRTTMEPPSHRQCAEFAVKNCPFLTKPMAKYSTKPKPEGATIDGTLIDRNPGVTLIWETLAYKPFRVGDGWLITVGDPKNVTAWREGRHATREELLESVMSGIPILNEEAEKEGKGAVDELIRTLGKWQLKVLDKYFPETH